LPIVHPQLYVYRERDRKYKKFVIFYNNKIFEGSGYNLLNYVFLIVGVILAQFAACEEKRSNFLKKNIINK